MVLFLFCFFEGVWRRDLFGPFFAELAPRPFQSISCNVNLLWMCRPVCRRPELRGFETSGQRVYYKNLKKRKEKSV